MKEFAVYTGLRILVFVATFAVVSGIWILTAGSLNWFYALLVAFVVSGVASYTLLNRQRLAFAQRVDARATRAVEAMRSKEDEDRAEREKSQLEKSQLDKSQREKHA
ncbi:DUF4229 domain-containing protein [Nocardioides sp. DS6]|uniref:DUF4229 domain-containing protein n=1 Tax=Nocardioides eburneus TaxID=3231482 RepID=A0ABV3STF9_9ACTN